MISKLGGLLSPIPRPPSTLTAPGHVLAPDWPAGLLVDLAPFRVSRGLVYSRNLGNGEFLQWFKHNVLHIYHSGNTLLFVNCLHELKTHMILLLYAVLHVQ